MSESPEPGPSPADTCPFCAEGTRQRAVATLGTVFAIPDAAPVSEGHLLVVTRRHARDLFGLTEEEMRDAMALLAELRERALRADPAVTGFNVGANCGPSAGQVIMHAHIHFIPRREDDGPGHRGVKGVIRNRMSY